MFVVFWCSVTGFVLSESYKVLMLLQISLFSWVTGSCGCLFPDIVRCGCVWYVSDGCLLGRLLFLLFLRTSFCFCVFRSWLIDGWCHARWMGVGVDWITQSKAHQSYSVCWSFFVLVAGFSKVSVACVCALGLFGVAWKDCRDVAQNYSLGALLSAAFWTKSKGCKGKNAHNSQARTGSACKVFCVFARDKNFQWK